MSKSIYIFLNFYTQEKIFFLLDGLEKKRIKEKDLENYSNYRKKIFLISDLFNSFKINLPETNLANQKKAIPFLIQDQLAEDINNYYYFLNAKEEILVLTEKQKLKELINGIDLYSISSLYPIETSFTKDSLIVIEDKVILSIKNQWYWSGSLDIFKSYISLLKEKFSDKIIESHCLKKIPEDLKNIDFLKFKIHQDIDSLWFENLPSIKNDFNLLQKQFEPKINWLEKAKELKFYIFSAVTIYSIFLLSSLIQIGSLSISSYQFKNQLTEIFNDKFPNEIIKNDLISQVNNLINLNSFSKRNLDSLRLLSNEISLMEDLSLVSINSDLNNLIIEVEATDYAQMEKLVKLMSTLGIELSIGNSRRLNNLLLGELNVRNL